jgi:hypothetical protein
MSQGGILPISPQRFFPRYYEGVGFVFSLFSHNMNVFYLDDCASGTLLGQNSRLVSHFRRAKKH